jgi:hypothetical protein
MVICLHRRFCLLILIPIILFLIPLCLKLKDNFEKWKINVPVKHTEEIIPVVLAEVPAGVFFFVLADNTWSLVAATGMMMFWFWFLFDGFYNLMRRWWRKKQGMLYSHLTWWYTGTNDKDDAKSDNFLQSIKLWQHVFIKIGGIVLFTILYIILYETN